MNSEKHKITTYREFWPFYLSEHSRVGTKRCHAVGTVLGMGFAAYAIGSDHPILLLPALAIGYAFAWYSHFFIEKNRPATFRYPWWSFISDFRMLFLYVLRKL